MERLILKKLIVAEYKEYQVKILNRFAALENFGDDMDSSKAWNKVLQRIFGHKMNELIGGWRKLHNEELMKLEFFTKYN
jgi:hypothetical protein